MQTQTYTPDATEQALINKYELEWKTQGDQFIVYSNRHRKKLGKFGPMGNLYALLTDAQKATEKLEADPRYQNRKPQPVTTLSAADVAEAQRRFEAGVPMPVAPTPSTKPPAIITNVVLDDSGGKTKRPPKEKAPPRDPAKARIYQTVKAWLTFPNDDPKKIKKRLDAQGLDVKDSVIIAYRSHCQTVVRAMIEMGFILPQELKERRETRVMQQKAENEPKNN